MANEEDIYFLDGEAIGRILVAPPNGKLCQTVKVLCGEGRVCACRKCFRKVLEANVAVNGVANIIESWGIILIDDGELIDIECARLITKLNPAFTKRPEIYEQKIAIIAKSRINKCVLVTDDTNLASSSMTNICDRMNLTYKTFDDLFGNLWSLCKCRVQFGD